MIGWLYRWIRRSLEGERLSAVSVESALDVIERKGYKAHRYFAAIGNRIDPDLSYALDTLEAAGFIVTDARGELVGGLATARPSKGDIAKARRAEFRIVE